MCLALVGSSSTVFPLSRRTERALLSAIPLTVAKSRGADAMLFVRTGELDAVASGQLPWFLPVARALRRLRFQVDRVVGNLAAVCGLDREKVLFHIDGYHGRRAVAGDAVR